MVEYTSNLDNLVTNLQRDRRVPLVVMVLLVILIIIEIGQTIQLFHFPQAPSTLHVNVTHRTLPPLANDHLFGIYDEALANLPPTQLQLELEGTEIPINSTGKAAALIASPNGPAKLYTIGQTVPGGAVIVHIFRDRVILNHAGSLESLNLPVPVLGHTN